jgi:pyruvate,water dikinase
MDLTKRLDEVGRDDVAIAGGKSAPLGELSRLGLRVPRGFVLLTSGYNAFAAANGLNPKIQRLLHATAPDAAEPFETTSAAIRALFDQGTIPREVEESLRARYRWLGPCPVAVRSSALAEDSPALSYAGQHESYLMIKGFDSLVHAVRCCWSSLWTPRALAYRVTHGIDPTTISLAVIVQTMVPAEAAGVLFTVHPLTGARDELMINATWGLGEAVVGGRVTPDRLAVDKASGLLRRILVGDKAVMTVRAGAGTIDRAVDPAQRSAAVLTGVEIAELARIARVVEAHFGCPQDVEWAIAQGNVYVLQSRPITTLPTQPVEPSRTPTPVIPPGDDGWDQDSVAPSQPHDLWTRTNLGENFPDPVTPLSATTWPALFSPPGSPIGDQSSSASSPPPSIGRRFYGRVYVNEGAMVRLIEDFGLPISFLDAVWGSRERGVRRPGDHFRPRRVLRSVLPLAWRTLRQGGEQPATRKPKPPSLKAQAVFVLVERWVTDFCRQDRSKLDDPALWAQGPPLWRERASALGNLVPTALLAAVAIYFLQRCVSAWTGKREDAAGLVMALSGIHTAELGPALHRLAETLRGLHAEGTVLDHPTGEALDLLARTPALAPFREQFDAFLERYGHHCPNDAELANPRWRDAPDQVIALLAGYLQTVESDETIARERQQRVEREAATARIAAQLGPVRRLLFHWLLRRAQDGVRARDNYRSCVTTFLYPVRTVFATLGQRWTTRGWLGQPDDVYFLTLGEVEHLATTGQPTVLGKPLRDVVSDRRAAFDFWQHVDAPEIIGPDGVPIVIETLADAPIGGVPASPGRTRGTARLVTKVQEAMRLKSGDILVTHATDPGWTAVFPLVGGLVLEVGGQLSHGAIIAREYGIPAVVSVRGAMQRIRDGETIVVDGTAGRVEVGTLACLDAS